MTEFRIRRAAAGSEPDWAVIERIWAELATPYAPDPRLEQLTPGQRSIYALKWLEAEVDNGGFVQYFTNSTGYLWPEAAAGAQRLGLVELAQVLVEAARPLGDPYPRDRQFREAVFNVLPQTYDLYWEPLDERFYELEDEMTATMLDYIDSYPDEFYVDP